MTSPSQTIGRHMSMQDSKSPYRRLAKAGGLFFLLLTFSLIVFNFLGHISRSQERSLDQDERQGLYYAVDLGSFQSILFKGAGDQGSPSPLEFLIIKAFYNLREEFRYFGLTPHGFYRIFSNIYFNLSAVLVLFLYFRKIRYDSPVFVSFLQSVTLMGAVATYLFGYLHFRYAGIMRPYALWESLWFVALAYAILEDRNDRVLSVILSALALAATPSFFQINALATGLVVAGILEGKGKESFQRVLKIIAIPLLISIYYLFRVNSFSYPSPTWEQFFSIWKIYKWDPILSVIGLAVCAYSPATRRYTPALVAVLVMYLLGPLFVILARMKGVFIDFRHFIYYQLAVPVFLLTLVRCMPHYLSKNNIVPKGLFIGFLFVSLHISRGELLNLPRELFTSLKEKRTFGLLHDPEGILKSFVIDQRLCPKFLMGRPDMNSAQRADLFEFSYWFKVVYTDLPESNQAVRVRPQGESNLEVYGMSNWGK